MHTPSSHRDRTLGLWLGELGVAISMMLAACAIPTSGFMRYVPATMIGTQIGLPPKRAAQLIRFDDAAHRLATGTAAVEVADACGYADQSHLHRDARLFAGMTPAGVAAAPWLDIDPNGDIAGHGPIAELVDEVDTSLVTRRDDIVITFTGTGF